MCYSSFFSSFIAFKSFLRKKLIIGSKYNILPKIKTKIMETYKEGSEIPYLFIDELPLEEQKSFILFQFGSTAPLIKGQEHRLTAYISDYRKWIFKTQLTNGKII